MKVFLHLIDSLGDQRQELVSLDSIDHIADDPAHDGTPYVLIVQQKGGNGRVARRVRGWSTQTLSKALSELSFTPADGPVCILDLRI